MSVRNISVSLCDGGHTLFFPLQEDIDAIPRIRIGETVARHIDDYVAETWQQCESGFPVGLMPHADAQHYKRSRIELLAKMRSITSLMTIDFRNFLQEIQPHIAERLVEKKIMQNTGINDLSLLTDEQYETEFDRASQEEKEGLKETLRGAQAFAQTGDPRLTVAMGRLGDYLEAYSYLNLYIAGLTQHISQLTDKLYGKEATEKKEKTAMKVNLALNPFFLQIANNSYNFNPQGFFGGSSYAGAAEIIAKSLFDGVRIFNASASPEQFDAAYKDGNMPHFADVRNPKIPVIYDVYAPTEQYGITGRRNPVITPKTFIEWTFEGNGPGRSFGVYANYPGSVLALKTVAERFAGKTVIEDYHEQTSSHQTRILLQGSQ